METQEAFELPREAFFLFYNYYGMRALTALCPYLWSPYSLFLYLCIFVSKSVYLLYFPSPIISF